jgi:hypothetical protein
MSQSASVGDSIQIRQAEPSDGAVAAALLYSAYTHRQVNFPLQGAYDHGHGWLERSEYFFRQNGNRFSDRNIQIATHSSEVVGLIFSFAGRDEPHA